MPRTKKPSRASSEGEWYRAFADDVRALSSRLQTTSWAEEDPRIENAIEQFERIGEHMIEIAIGKNRAEVEKVEREEMPLFKVGPGESAFAVKARRDKASIGDEKKASIEQPIVAEESSHAEKELRVEAKQPIQVRQVRADQLGLRIRVDDRHLIGPKVDGIPGYPPLAKSKYVDADYAPELERLADEIDQVNPNLIVCLGNTPLWALAGRSGITKLAPSRWNNSRIRSIYDSIRCFSQNDSETLVKVIIDVTV